LNASVPALNSAVPKPDMVLENTLEPPENRKVPESTTYLPFPVTDTLI